MSAAVDPAVCGDLRQFPAEHPAQYRGKLRPGHVVPHPEPAVRIALHQPVFLRLDDGLRRPVVGGGVRVGVGQRGTHKEQKGRQTGGSYIMFEKMVHEGLLYV